MNAERGFSFDHDARRDIYEYLRKRGPTSPERIWRDLHVDSRGFRHHVAILKRDGYVEDAGDTGDGLRVVLDPGEREQFRDSGVEFAIRPARESDLSGLVGVIRQVAAEKTYIEAETVADVVDHEEVLLRHDEIEERMFFVACVDAEVVGWVHLHVPELEKLSHTAEITLGVVEGYRGHGIGGHLLQRGLEWGAKNGLAKVYQSVPATNQEAVSFLQAHGWEVEAVREDHYRLDGEYVDEVMMAVEL
jgi:ribosomal protein S18 acetylase RimI-like enzyme